MKDNIVLKWKKEKVREAEGKCGKIEERLASINTCNWCGH